MSDFQREILSDGDVTFSEYERAVFATVDCITSEGVDVIGPYLESDEADHGVRSYYGGGRDKTKWYAFAVVGATLAESDRAEAIRGACEAEYLDAVVFVYGQINQPSEAEVAAFYRDLAVCLADNGIEIPDEQPTTLDLLATRNWELGCW